MVDIERFLLGSGLKTMLGKNGYLVMVPYILGVRSQDDVAVVEAEAVSASGISS